MSIADCKIEQMLPAPGWKCFFVNREEDGSLYFGETPVIGWAVVSGHLGPADDQEIYPVIFEAKYGQGMVFDRYEDRCENFVRQVYPPGTMLESVKSELSAELAPKMSLADRQERQEIIRETEKTSPLVSWFRT